VARGGTQADGLFSATESGGFADVGAGTSYAAPHITGVLALLLEQEPELTPEEQRARLLAACAPLPDVDQDTQGAGAVSLTALFATQA
jgi:serine protease AprX